MLYSQFWHWFCDVCIEEAKNDGLSQENLEQGMVTFLKLFHPYMPFVTEAIWQEFYKGGIVTDPLLVVSEWPNPTDLT